MENELSRLAEINHSDLDILRDVTATENKESTFHTAENGMNTHSTGEADGPQPANEGRGHPAEHSDLLKDFQQSVADYSARTPDFSDAFNFLADKREQQLKALSLVDPQYSHDKTRAKQLQNEALELIRAAKSANLDPAETIYQIAQSFGYHRHDYYQQLSQAQSASRSLTASPGFRAGQPVGVDSLAQMSQADFEKWYWNNKDEFRRIMGG